MDSHDDQRILDSVPEKAPRSKLAPHLELIRGLRKKQRTFLEIKAILAERCAVQVAASTIFNFLKVRARAKPDASAPQATKVLASPKHFDDPIEMLRRRPPAEERPKKFHFTPGEPLELPPRKDHK